MKDNTEDAGLPPSRGFYFFLFFLALYECDHNHAASLECLNGSIARKRQSSSFYDSRSAAVSAHCLLWIGRSPIEPLHFFPPSLSLILHYTAIGIRIRRFAFLSPGSATRLAFWLPAEIDTQVATYHLNLTLIADIVPFSANLCFQRVWLQWKASSRCAQGNWSIVYRSGFFRPLSYFFFSSSSASNCIKISFVARV